MKTLLAWLHVDASDERLADSRNRYLDALPGPQDYYSESLVAETSARLLTLAGSAIGYARIGAERRLVEFHVEGPALVDAAFEALLESEPITGAIVKSDDLPFARLALANIPTVTPLGLRFSEVRDAHSVENLAIRVRRAELPDIPALNEINDDFFDSDKEIERYVRRGQITLFEGDDGLLGCGLLQPIVDGRPWRDVGMLVSPKHRRRGLGVYIVRWLKARCFLEGLNPVSACGIENVASAACLRAAGFIGENRILDVEFAPSTR